MKRELLRRSMNILIVLLLLSSGLAILSNSSVSTPETEKGNILGYIKVGTTYINGVTVSLYDISTNRVKTTSITDRGFYQFKSIDFGYYEVVVYSQKIDKTIYFTNRSGVIRIDSINPQPVNINLTSKVENAHLTGTVTYGDSHSPVNGATVTLSDTKRRYQVSTSTSYSGTYFLNFYANESGEEFVLSIRKADPAGDYLYYNHSVTLGGDNELSDYLANKPMVVSTRPSEIRHMLFKNSIELINGTDYTLNFTTGLINFTNGLLKNNDVVTANYNYTSGKERLILNEYVNASGGWSVGDNPLYLDFGHVNNTPLQGYLIKKNSVIWPSGNNYTFDNLTGTITLRPTVDIQIGDIITASYKTSEWEVIREQVLTSGENILDPALSQNIVIGQVFGGQFPTTSKIRVTLYDKDNRSSLSSVSQNSNGIFTIGAYTGRYILVVDLEDYKSNTTLLFNVPADNEKYFNTPIYIMPSEKEFWNTTIGFKNDNDWGNITTNTYLKLVQDSNYLGIGNETLGNLRFQIDLNFGDGNGELTQPEITKFEYWLENRTPNYVTTPNIFTFNDKYYNSTDTANDVIEVKDLAGMPSSITSDKEFWINTTVNSTTSGIKQNQETYTIKLKVSYDTLTRNYAYYIKLPKYYEMTDYSPKSSSIVVSGYRNITIDPQYGTGQTEMTLTIKRNANATAIARIWAWNDPRPLDDRNNSPYKEYENYAYRYSPVEENNTYLVSKDKNITFTGLDSTDPVGKIARYKWFWNAKYNLSDCSNWTSNVTIAHKFTSEYSNVTTHDPVFTIELWVEDSYGNITKTNSTTNLSVMVDYKGPTPNLSTNKTLQNYIDQRAINVNVGDIIKFNGTNSTDYINDSGDKGIIRTYSWDFGDNTTATGQNQTKVYDRSGIFYVVLNVTDVVGRYKNTTVTGENITILVKPRPNFTIWNSTGANVTASLQLEENKMAYFNASGSIGPIDTIITYLNWTFKFGNLTEYRNLTNSPENLTVNYTFPKGKVGIWDVTLNVTDTFGNYTTTMKQISVFIGPRPNLAIKEITFSNTKPEEGDTITISVNITNCLLPDGNISSRAANATNVSVTFYDGDTLISGNVQFYNKTGVLIGTDKLATLSAGEYVIAKLDWEVTEQGNHSIKVNVTCEFEVDISENEKTVFIEVAPAAWKRTATIGGVIAILIILILIYLWRKGKLSFARFRKGEEEKEKGASKKEKREAGKGSEKKFK